MPTRLPPYRMINSTAALRDLAADLMRVPLVAVDTESNSLYAYREQVCLIQLSTRDQDYIVDPLSVNDLSPLAPVFAAPEIEKVFHAGDNDVMVLKRDFGFTFANLFDTMVAARILGRKSFGLGAMLEEYFGVAVDKRFQKANWAIRPLPRDQLDYARTDTHYLPALRDALKEAITAGGHDQEAAETFDFIASVRANEATFDPDGFWFINAARDLPRRQMASLREIYLLRERIAEARNTPPFKVMSDETMVSLARQTPAHVNDLYEMSGLSDAVVSRYGEDILDALRRGRAAQLPQRPHQNRRDDATMERYQALRDWRKHRAIARGVESDVIIPKEALMALAENPPTTLEEVGQVHGIGAWRLAQYGAEILEVLRKAAAQ